MSLFIPLKFSYQAWIEIYFPWLVAILTSLKLWWRNKRNFLVFDPIFKLLVETFVKLLQLFINAFVKFFHGFLNIVFGLAEGRSLSLFAGSGLFAWSRWLLERFFFNILLRSVWLLFRGAVAPNIYILYFLCVWVKAFSPILNDFTSCSWWSCLVGISITRYIGWLRLLTLSASNLRGLFLSVNALWGLRRVSPLKWSLIDATATWLSILSSHSSTSWLSFLPSFICCSTKSLMTLRLHVVHWSSSLARVWILWISHCMLHRMSHKTRMHSHTVWISPLIS